MYSARFAVLVSFLFLCLAAGFALAEQELKIKVSPGQSSDYNTDLTLDALKEGKTDYTVSGMGKTYQVKLTGQQVKDVLKGTTVMVDSSMNGGSAVRVSLTVEGEEESSGW